MIKETFPKRLFPSPSLLLRNFYSISESNCQVVLPEYHLPVLPDTRVKSPWQALSPTPSHSGTMVVLRTKHSSPSLSLG